MGGQGAVREISERILKARGDWEPLLEQAVSMKHRRLIQRALLTVVVLTLVAVVIVFIGYRRITRNP